MADLRGYNNNYYSNTASSRNTRLSPESDIPVRREVQAGVSITGIYLETNPGTGNYM